jgi:hypothetical protein
MGYSPAPGTTWGMRFWLFVVALSSAVSLVIYREVDLPWYFRLPLGIVIIHGFYSAAAALRGAYTNQTTSEA